MLIEVPTGSQGLLRYALEYIKGQIEDTDQVSVDGVAWFFGLWLQSYAACRESGSHADRMSRWVQEMGLVDPAK